MNKIFNHTILKEVVADLSEPILMNEWYQPVDNDGKPIAGLANEEYTINGFITNPDIQKHSTRNLHSLDLFRSGDIFKLENDNYYIVTDDVLEKRGAKYKGVARYCNFEFSIVKEIKVLVDRQPNGAPIYDYIIITIGYVRGYSEFDSFGINNGGIVTLNNDLLITIRDNVDNRNEFKLNKVLKIKGQYWKVIGIDLSRDGLMTLKTNSTTV